MPTARQLIQQWTDEALAMRQAEMNGALASGRVQNQDGAFVQFVGDADGGGWTLYRDGFMHNYAGRYGLQYTPGDDEGARDGMYTDPETGARWQVASEDAGPVIMQMLRYMRRYPDDPVSRDLAAEYDRMNKAGMQGDFGAIIHRVFVSAVAGAAAGGAFGGGSVWQNIMPTPEIMGPPAELAPDRFVGPPQPDYIPYNQPAQFARNLIDAVPKGKPVNDYFMEDLLQPGPGADYYTDYSGSHAGADAADFPGYQPEVPADAYGPPESARMPGREFDFGPPVSPGTPGSPIIPKTPGIESLAPIGGKVVDFVSKLLQKQGVQQGPQTALRPVNRAVNDGTGINFKPDPKSLLLLLAAGAAVYMLAKRKG